MATGPYRIARVMPRMDQGGAEQGILQLLHAIPDTHMLVTGLEGTTARAARTLAAAYTFAPPPNFCRLVEALSGVPIVHLHTLNEHPLAPLAAQLAGADLIVETLHNHYDSDTCLLVDFTILVGTQTRAVLPVPGRAEWVPNGIPCPPQPPRERPRPEAGVPLQLVEVRRPDKAMRFTLEEVLATGLLDDLDVRASIVGPGGTSGDPRVECVGLVDDPGPWLAKADVLVCGSASDSFGRVPFEALAHGAVPFVSDLPSYTELLASEGLACSTAASDARAAAVELRTLVSRLAADPEATAALRARGHAFVRDRYSVAAMIAHTERIYARESTRPDRRMRSFGPADVDPDSLSLFGSLIDDLCSGQPLRDAARTSELAPGLRGVFLWALARYGELPLNQRADLLRASRGDLGDRPIVLYHLGCVERDLGLASEGARTLERAVELEPANVAARMALAECHIQLGDVSGVETVLADLARDVPEYAGTRELLELFDRPEAQPAAASGR